MKFKVGDKVIGKSSASLRYTYTREGYIATIISIEGNLIRIKNENGMVYDVSPEYFKLLKTKKVDIRNLNKKLCDLK